MRSWNSVAISSNKIKWETELMSHSAKKYWSNKIINICLQNLWNSHHAHCWWHCGNQKEFKNIFMNIIRRAQTIRIHLVKKALWMMLESQHLNFYHQLFQVKLKVNRSSEFSQKLLLFVCELLKVKLILGISSWEKDTVVYSQQEWGRGGGGRYSQVLLDVAQTYSTVVWFRCRRPFMVSR